MPGPIVNQEWLNQNSVRKYPLSEEATGWDATDTFELPDNFIVDMVLPVHSEAGLDVSRFHVLQVVLFGTGVAVTVGYAGAPVASITVPVQGFSRNTTYFLQGVGDFTDVLGKITIGTLDTILLSAGAYDFDIAGGRIEASIPVPDIRGVQSLRLVEENEETDLIQGDIAFEAGSNTRFDLTEILVGSELVKVLTINAIDGEGTIADCSCDGDIAERPGIKTLSGVGPDSNGNVELIGDDCIAVEPNEGDNKVELQDDCSKPCCGCPELEALIADQQRVRDNVQTIENLAYRLDAAVAAMTAIIGAST